MFKKLLLSSFVILILSLSFASAVVVDGDIYPYLKLQLTFEPNVTYNDAPSTEQATCLSGNCPTQDGAVKAVGSYSASYDGTNDMLTIPGTAQYIMGSGGGDNTICAWVYPIPASYNTNDGWTGRFCPTCSDYWYAQIFGVVFYTQMNLVGSNVVGGNLNQNDWTYVCYSFNDATNDLKSYMNGSYVATSNIATDMSDGAGSDLWIGGSGSGINRYKPMNLDNYIWVNKTLSADEITYLYNSGAGRTLSGNSAPAISNLKINTTNGLNDTFSDLNCVATITDAEANAVSGNFEWYMNGVNQTALAESFTSLPSGSVVNSTISYTNTNPTQNWSCRVNSNDGSLYSGWSYSVNLTIKDRTPYTSGTAIKSNLLTNFTTENLNCSTTLYDDDGQLLNVTQRWYVNGVLNNSNVANNNYVNGSYISYGIPSIETNSGENWSCSFVVTDGNLAMNEMFSVNLTILDNTKSVVTNLTSYSGGINWPALIFDVNVSLGQFWNENPTCTLNENASYVTCLPSNTVISLANNITIFTCTATERNTEDVLFYANCSDSIEDINSSIVTINIDADSHPYAIMNTTGSYNDFTLGGFDINITAYNYTTTVIGACVIAYNDSGLTCTNGIADEVNTYEFSRISICTPDYVQEKDYTINVTCDGEGDYYLETVSTNYNIGVDANANPIVTANFTDLSLKVNEPYDILVTGLNVAEITTCTAIWNDSIDNSECTNATLASGSPTTDVIVCTEIHNETETHEVFVSCNSALYNFNSSVYTITHDTIEPQITLINPNPDNSSWKLDSDSFIFDLNATHPGIVNISSLTVNCYNQSNDLLYGTVNNTDSENFYYNSPTNNFSNSDIITCNFIANDTFGVHQTNISSLITVVTIPATNLSLINNKTNNTFTFSTSYDFFGESTDCTGITNTSSINCDINTGTTSSTVTCTPTGTFETVFSIYAQCNSTIGNANIVSNSTSVDLWFDNTIPVIIINNPPSSGTGFYYNTSNVTLSATITDSNVFGVNITCYNYSTGNIEYSYEEVDINSTSYNLINITQFHNPGLMTCDITTSDDHTDKIYYAKVEINTDKLGFGDNKLIIREKDTIDGKAKDNIKVEIVYDTKSDVAIDRFDYIAEYDRIKPIMILDDDLANKPDFCDIVQSQDCVNPDTTYKTVMWEVKFDGDIYFREQYSGIPGHIVLIPTDGSFLDGQWYDALDDYDNSITTLKVKNKKLYYTKKIPLREFYAPGGNVVTSKSIGGINVDTKSWNFTIGSGKIINFIAYNDYNKSSILNFNITTYNGSTSNTITTATGNASITVGNEATFVNVTTTEYYNKHLLYSVSQNLSDNYNLTFWQVALTIYTRNIQDNSLVAGTNVTLANWSGYDYYSTNASNPATFYINKLQHEVNVSGTATMLNTSYYNPSGLGLFDYTVYLYSNFTVCIYDEASEQAFNMSSPNTVTQYTYCTDEFVFANVLTDACTAYISVCEIDKVKYVFQYPTDRYYRTLLSRAFNVTLGNITVWAIDLDTTQTVFNTFQIYALNNVYDNARLYFKKNIGTIEYVITSDYIDVEEKVGTYLMLGEEYTVELEADNYPTTSLGFYSADAAGAKILQLFEISYDLDPTGGWDNNSWWVETDNSTTPSRAKVTYRSKDLSSATLSVYNGSKQGALLYTTTVTSDSGVIYYNPPTEYENYTFQMQLNLTKDSGETVKLLTTWRANTRIALDIITLGLMTATWFGFFIAILLSVIALIFSWSSADIGGIIFIAIAGLFISFGWITIANVTLGLAVLVAVINFIKKRDMGGPMNI